MKLDFSAPEGRPWASGMLQLDRLHSMYWQQSGNPQGQPVVILHGGPGAGMDPSQAQVFDPLHYRIIEFDQRGCGKSVPQGELTRNTTQHLIADIELLRRHLGLQQWLVMGGSWGSSLALAYAQQHPGSVSGILLRGIFLCTRDEVQWYLYGIRNVYPEVWQRFSDFLPQDQREDLLLAYSQLLLDSDPAVAIPAARAWCLYEASCSALLPDPESECTFPDQHALMLARIQAHYFTAGFFVAEDELLENLYRIRSIPCVIVQGRYDMICPVKSADQLHRLWPQARYQIVPNAGHAASEPGTRRALRAAADSFRRHPDHTLPEGVSHEQGSRIYAQG